MTTFFLFSMLWLLADYLLPTGYSVPIHRITTTCILLCTFWPTSTTIQQYQLPDNIQINHYSSSHTHLVHIFCATQPCSSQNWSYFLFKLPLYPTILVVADNALWHDRIRQQLPTQIRRDWIFTPYRFEPSLTRHCSQVGSLFPLRFIDYGQSCRICPGKPPG